MSKSLFKPTIIGIDFSITKTGVCIRYSPEANEIRYQFYGFPRPDHISEKRKFLYIDNGAYIAAREDVKNPHKDSSAKMAFAVENSQYLAKMIVASLKWCLGTSTYIVFEGLSFGSTGDAILQLSGYKYILMDKLSQYVPLENMYTYAPITIKKTAGCSKRGLGKNDMIDAFLQQGTEFGNNVKNNLDVFKKKGGKNYIELLDDLVDSYWAIKTLEEKEGF